MDSSSCGLGHWMAGCPLGGLGGYIEAFPGSQRNVIRVLLPPCKQIHGCRAAVMSLSSTTPLAPGSLAAMAGIYWRPGTAGRPPQAEKLLSRPASARSSVLALLSIRKNAALKQTDKPKRDRPRRKAVCSVFSVSGLRVRMYFLFDFIYNTSIRFSCHQKSRLKGT